MRQIRKNKSPAERIVCFCYSVSEQAIVDAIKNGCGSLMDIRRETYASTGCAGCSEEVKKLLRKHANRDPGAPTSPNQDSGKQGNGA